MVANSNVGDGLRADKAFQSFPDPSPGSEGTEEGKIPRPLAPFLRSRVLEHGLRGNKSRVSENAERVLSKHF